ncbi:DoxX family protein [Aquiflexum lacus]|uniref:DoxX family protein n=1 Tax=Aquiflexum lacus TaxID=2483805 RepID=UPI00189357EF|nr:DoxX family protein [Aquiflexum lacus]
MKKLFFSTTPFLQDLGLAILRISTSLMLVTHGWAKIENFSERLTTFSDPIGLGPAASLQLVIFAEFFCAILLALGFLSRLTLIPLIINMAVISFVVHGDDPFSNQEKGLLFLVIFVFLMFAGPGKYSVDAQIIKNGSY